MARPSLDELYSDTVKPRPSLDDIYAEVAAPGYKSSASHTPGARVMPEKSYKDLLPMVNPVLGMVEGYRKTGSLAGAAQNVYQNMTEAPDKPASLAEFVTRTIPEDAAKTGFALAAAPVQSLVGQGQAIGTALSGHPIEGAKQYGNQLYEMGKGIVEGSTRVPRAIFSQEARDKAITRPVETALFAYPIAKGGMALAGDATKALGQLRPVRDAGLEALSKEHDVPLTAGELTNSQGLKITETGLERVPLGIGTRAFREAQSGSLKNAAERLVSKFGNEAGNLQENIQGNMLKTLKSNKGAASEAYGSVEKAIGVIEAKGTKVDPIDPVNLRQASVELIKDYSDLFERLPDPMLKKKIERIASGAMEESPGPNKMATGAMLRPATLSFPEARLLRGRIGNYIDRAYKSAGAVGSQETNLLSRVKSALDADIDAWGFNSKHQDVVNAYRNANQVYQAKIAPFKDFVVKKATGNEFDTDLLVKSFVKQDRPQLAAKLMNTLDGEGQQLVKYAILKDALEIGTDTKPGVPFSPAKFAQNIEKLGKTKNVLFSPEERTMVDGFVKLSRAAERAGQFAENPPTGLRANDTGIQIAGGAGLITHPLATISTAAALKGLSLLLTTKTGKSILTRAAGTPEYSVNWKGLLDRSGSILSDQRGALGENLDTAIKSDTLPVERRRDYGRRSQIDEMVKQADVEGLHKTIYEDPLTGLLNRRAWDEAEPQAQGKTIASLDMSGLKYANDNFGYEAGDAILKAYADALKEQGIEAYRKGGDEVVAVFDGTAHAENLLQRAQKALADKTIQVTTPDGKVYEAKGWRFDYGTGKDFTEADSNFKAARAKLVAEGKRNPRGGKPNGVVETVSQGVKTNDPLKNPI